MQHKPNTVPGSTRMGCQVNAGAEPFHFEMSSSRAKSFYKICDCRAGSEYGPFSTKRMQVWQHKGYFSSNLRVRHVGKLAQPFMSIEELFGRSVAEPFAAIGTVDELYFYMRDLSHAVEVLGSKQTVNNFI